MFDLSLFYSDTRQVCLVVSSGDHRPTFRNVIVAAPGATTIPVPSNAFLPTTRIAGAGRDRERDPVRVIPPSRS